MSYEIGPQPPDDDDIVGHKTLSTDQTSPDGFPVFRHEPLTRAEAEALIAASDREIQRRADEMPDEGSAIIKMFDAYQRLRELGWKDACYCPKDGSVFAVIEAGSGGVHQCVYFGEWPTGHYMTLEGGDLWPSRPTLFKPTTVER